MHSSQIDPFDYETDIQAQIDAAPEQAPRPARLVVIPCTGSKLPTPAPARFLYTGSTFAGAKDAAFTLAGYGGRVMILSALHGLVDLHDELAPYDVKMGDPDAIDSAAGARSGLVKLADQIAAEFAWLATESETGAVDVQFLLPNAYRQAFETALQIAAAFHELPPYTTRNLYAGARGIGDQKSICRRIRTGELS